MLPMEDINLHFTGDFSAIEKANNLLAALIDNNIQSGLLHPLEHAALTRNHHTTRRVAIQTMNDAGTGEAAGARKSVQERVHQRSVRNASAGVDNQARRLAEHGNVVVDDARALIDWLEEHPESRITIVTNSPLTSDNSH